MGEKIVMSFGDTETPAELADNETARALLERLESGPVAYMADDYGGFEKVGAPGFRLPASDEQISTEPGDLVLHQEDKLCIYYGANTWSFARIGRILDAGNPEERLGAGAVGITPALG